VILALCIKLFTAKARIAGYEDALDLIQMQRQATNTNQTQSSGIGCMGILAIIGFISICALCFYFGSML